jgi:hypothetical protein
MFLYLLTNGVFIGYLLCENNLKLLFYISLYNKNKANKKTILFKFKFKILIKVILKYKLQIDKVKIDYNLRVA